jgi:WD40 repeat protein
MTMGSSVAFSHDGSKIVSGSGDKTIRVWDASTGVEMLPPLRGHDDGLHPSHSRTMDPKLSRGLKTRPFEFGMQTRGRDTPTAARPRHYRLHPSHSRTMDPKLSRGLTTRPFESGMQTRASRCSHRCGATTIGLHPSHSRTMDPKLSRGLDDKTIRVLGCKHGRRDAPTAPGPRRLGYIRRILARWIQNCLGVRRQDHSSLGCKHGRRDAPTAAGPRRIMLHPSHSRTMDPKLSRGPTTRPFESGMQTRASRCSHRCGATTIGLHPSHSRTMDPKLSRGLTTRPFESGMQTRASRCSHRCGATTIYVTSVAFSHDGSKIVSGSDDKTIRVWDANTGVEMLPPLRGHDDYVTSVAFSHDGSKIVSGSNDKTIRVWDANTGVEMLPPLRGHDEVDWMLHPSHSRTMDPKLSRGLTTRPFESGMQTRASRCSHRCGATTIGYIRRILARWIQNCLGV